MTTVGAIERPVHVGERVRRLRLVAGLDQAELAQRTQIASGSISKIENGRLVPKESEQLRLARALGCDPNFLVRPNTIGPATRPWLRAYADASQRALDRQLADCNLLAETIEVVGLKVLPDMIPTFRGDRPDDDEIESYALEVRETAGVAAGDALPNAVRVAERLGCVITPMLEELGRHVGLSIRANLIPVICLSRPSADPARHVPGDRQRFTVAHELGHLGLHASWGPPRDADEASRFEREANRFAGAFLAPADAILEDLRYEGGRVTLRTLAVLKERWGVAIKALVMRCRSLGVIDDDHARSLYKQISSRGWNRSEPVQVPNETAVWLEKAIRAQYRQATDAVKAAASDAGLDPSHLRRWMNWRPTAQARLADVISLTERRYSGESE